MGECVFEPKMNCFKVVILLLFFLEMKFGFLEYCPKKTAIKKKKSVVFYIGWKLGFGLGPAFALKGTFLR